MFRSLFLALGAYTCLLGVEALALEKAILKKPVEGNPRQYTEKDLVPPEWAPWSLMGGGAVVVLYSFTIPRRAKS
ncbi:MAG: hypothetical protein GXP24_07260 [Planctomycetes bacterium]|nr:hypothetical protein [Planctomycetota bacterium]